MFYWVWAPGISGPVHTFRDIFGIHNVFSPYKVSAHLHLANSAEILCVFERRLSRVEKKKSATNPSMRRANLAIFESHDVAKSRLVSCRSINNMETQS